MKKFKNYLALVVVAALVMTGCSIEETSSPEIQDENMASLSFGAVLNDLINDSQQRAHLSGFPECSDAAPAYVEVIITGAGYDGPDPLIIEVSDTPGDYDDDGEAEYFTLESDELELPAGSYMLEDFVVYDDDDNLIWIAPKDGSAMANYVDDALPTAITLNAGTKKYVDVEVLCYDKRMVNEYGYLFFELETNIALDFCFFANYCDENGRHFTAMYSVNIWYGTDDTGAVLYSGVSPTPQQTNGGEYFTEPLCFALPMPAEGVDDDEDYLYYEVTLMPWAGNYGTPPTIVESGMLSLDDIEDNFDGEDDVDYEHIKFGCESEVQPR
ncbi:hypothetical protein [Christiangramia sp. OXR-203]|jgi:hypothetical protein|uniref:hypothetical protein n=1 Tax=Christiangramia sp. OXR-203 TaxID=3100176 RepID=UPI002AC8CE04|nr:hypothetical protein [Christiangramia sp. OXR-203]WPY99679.1 hypothetical protein T8I65_05580 [Christiangramia sp. OXR-203]